MTEDGPLAQLHHFRCLIFALLTMCCWILNLWLNTPVVQILNNILNMFNRFTATQSKYAYDKENTDSIWKN